MRSAIKALREEQRGPTPKEMASHYAMLALNFPQAPMTAEQASIKFRTFCSDLAAIPAAAVSLACERYRTQPSPDGKQKFFPQTWQILSFCEEQAKESKAILAALEEMERCLSTPALTASEPECIDMRRAREIRLFIEATGRSAISTPKGC